MWRGAEHGGHSGGQGTACAAHGSASSPGHRVGARLRSAHTPHRRHDIATVLRHSVVQTRKRRTRLVFVPPTTPKTSPKSNPGSGLGPSRNAPVVHVSYLSLMQFNPPHYYRIFMEVPDKMICVSRFCLLVSCGGILFGRKNRIPKRVDNVRISVAFPVEERPF